MNYVLLGIIVCCILGEGVIMYDYLMGKITGETAWAFSCIVVAIIGLSSIQLIT